MNDFKYDVSRKQWKDFKATVKTAIAGNLNIDDLLLSTHNVSFDSLVPQTAIQTEEDKARYQSKGYSIPLTETEFKEKLKTDPSCVFYSPSVSCSCLYFNKDTLAASPFPVEFFALGIYNDFTQLDRSVEESEKEVATQDYMKSVLGLPDAMRMEYFNLLVDKKGPDIPGLYNLFFEYYVESDYGFGNIAPATLSAVLNSKTAKDRAKTVEQLKDLPEKLTIYRGGNTASTPYSEAYSWSLDINVANFFACRQGTGEGYIAEAEVDKKDIFEAFLNNRGEQEICVHPKDITVVQAFPIQGLGFVEDVLPKIAPMYHEYLNKLEKIPFTQDSADHGVGHEARVLLNALTIAHCLDLPLRDRRILAEAAIYHDTRRINDIDDSVHGKASKDYYHERTASPDPLVEFLCEYHCLPDEQGYDAILHDRKLGKSRSRSKLLIDIFKDADALDRVRFGIRDLDLNQLRVPVSKELTLAARLYLEHVKVPFKTRFGKPSLAATVQSAANRAEQAQAASFGKDLSHVPAPGRSV